MSKHTKSCMKTQPNCQCNTCIHDDGECCVENIGCPLTNCKNYKNEEENECQCYTCKKAGFPYCVNLKRGCKCKNYENEEEK